MIYYTDYFSPLGRVVLAANADALIGLWFDGQKHFPVDTSDWTRDDARAPFPRVKQWLDEYFDGRAPDTSQIPLAPRGTPFQRRVWHALQQIPHGGRVTYADIARQVSSAPRAVGTAIGRNPISLIIPCHRVVGHTGALTGYAGGVDRKEKLLTIEQGK